MLTRLCQPQVPAESRRSGILRRLEDVVFENLGRHQMWFVQFTYR